MVLRARTPCLHLKAEKGEGLRGKSRTHRGDDLPLNANLHLKTWRDIHDTPLVCGGDIRHFANLSEHLPAREEKNRDQTANGPEIAVLDDWDKVWPERCNECHGTHQKCRTDDQPRVVDRAGDVDYWRV